MPRLAITRNGVAASVRDSTNSLWLGSDVLSEPEIRRLRGQGFSLTVFIHPIKTREDIEDALITIEEHHPSEPISVEEMPATLNPRSHDVGQAFLWREAIVGVDFNHNELVEVVLGPNTGKIGSLVALIGLEPEPEFILETEFEGDIPVQQSQIQRRADA